MENMKDVVSMLSVMPILSAAFITKYLFLFLEMFLSHGDKNVFCY